MPDLHYFRFGVKLKGLPVVKTIVTIFPTFLPCHMPISQVPVGAIRHSRRIHRMTVPGHRAGDQFSSVTRCQGVLFDMCNIIFDDTVWRRWVLQLLSRIGLSTNYCSFFRLWDRDYLDDVHRGKRDFRRAFAEFLQCAGLSGGQIDEIEAASHARRRHLETHSRPLPGVRNTLSRMHKKGFALGIISNSEHTSAELRARLHGFGVERMFCSVISSIDINCCMPEPDSYAAAMKCMNLPPDKVAFVGHDRLELHGASAVGMPTVAFNFDSDAQADVHIGRFEELVDVLAKV
jgi:FMN phosphatase YigB (HAD superfamily)